MGKGRGCKKMMKAAKIFWIIIYPAKIYILTVLVVFAETIKQVIQTET